MDTFKNIVMLVDSDNTQDKKIQAIIQKISTYGRIVVKHVYGNWKKDCLKNWESIILQYAFNPVQQFDYVSGKNATDMALVIDAMELLYTKQYDAFVIVSSDSDYTPLTIKLKEAGIYIIGVGKQGTSKSFRQSCDDFIEIESLIVEENNRQKSIIDHENVKENSKRDKKFSDDEKELHDLLKTAADEYAEADGYANISACGSYVKRMKPDFDIKKFKVKKLPDFIQKYPELYEFKTTKGKGTLIFSYKCKW